jgi:protein tyrosine phosphatase (PTP) superfamily phosphohydrolase (DUF442 family)
MTTVYNFREVNECLACAGQPLEDQLTIIAASGYRAIINLGLSGGSYALTDEASSVKHLGMTYHHIPVVFENPQIDQLSQFITLMDAHADEKTFVHCAANYRASIFIGLYLLAIDKINKDEMLDFIGSVWQPNPVWQDFIEESVLFLQQPN